MSLPKPYYQDSAVTIYHGDCYGLLPNLPAGLVYLTDQPYGTGWVRGGGKVGEFRAKHERPEWDVWDLAWVSKAPSHKRIAMFCPASRTEEMKSAYPGAAILKYQKSNVRPGGCDFEPVICFPPPERGPLQFLAYNGDMPLHPCQKPMEIMLWLVALVSDPVDIVVDPFAGSGTTGRACKDLGRKCVLIEREERYCEIAARRMGQEVLNLT